MRLVTTREYLSLPRPALRWLIADLVPFPGTVLVTGPPKAGKSFLAFDLARCVALGIPFLGRDTIQARAVYLQFDTSETVWRDRLNRLGQAGVPVGDELLYVHPDDLRLPFDLSRPEDYLWLAELVTHSGADLFVIDVLRQIHNGDENDSTAMKAVGDKLLSLFRGKALVLVHHASKLAPDDLHPDPVRVARGSSYLTGLVDSCWLLWQGRLAVQPRFAEAFVAKLTQGPGGLWQLEAGDVDDMGQAVRRLCAEHPQVSHNSLAQLAEQSLGISRSTYYRLLSAGGCVHRASPS